MKTVSRVSLLVLSVLLISCEVIGDIFGAGVYTGVFVVVFVIGIIFLLFSRSRKK
jgi:hypothetical protein